MHTIDVTLPTERYEIRIEPGQLASIGDAVAEVVPHDKAFLVVDAKIAGTHGGVAAESLEAAGFEVVGHAIAADEKAKTLETVRAMYDVMLAARLERGSPVVALGGGIVGDVAGFAAATYLRGVPLVQVPTTLLAMVDASIGGKTGVNHPRPVDAAGRRDLGKNLIGAFWQPRAILVDPLVLATLEPRDFRCGLAESVKHAILADAGLLELIETHAGGIAVPNGEADAALLTELIRRSAAIKVGVVEADEREADTRMLLNLGHTFAHVIEPIETLDLRHGEAVAIGLVAASFFAVATGRLEADDARRVTELLTRLGLPTRLTHPEPVARLIEGMGYDKKVAGGRLRLVLPTSIGSGAEIVRDLPRSAIASAWHAVGASTDDGP